MHLLPDRYVEAQELGNAFFRALRLCGYENRLLHVIMTAVPGTSPARSEREPRRNLVLSAKDTAVTAVYYWQRYAGFLPFSCLLVHFIRVNC